MFEKKLTNSSWVENESIEWKNNAIEIRAKRQNGRQRNWRKSGRNLKNCYETSFNSNWKTHFSTPNLLLLAPFVSFKSFGDIGRFPPILAADRRFSPFLMILFGFLNELVASVVGTVGRVVGSTIWAYEWLESTDGPTARSSTTVGGDSIHEFTERDRRACFCIDACARRGLLKLIIWLIYQSNNFNMTKRWERSWNK